MAMRVMCRLSSISRPLAAPVWVRLEVQLPAPPIGYVGVELRRREVRVSQHLLHRAEVGATFEQVCGERVPQEMRMDALRLQPGLLRQPPEDQERARTREPSAFGVEEQLRAVTCIEERPAA